MFRKISNIRSTRSEFYFCMLTLCAVFYATSGMALTDPTRPGQYSPAPTAAQFQLDSVLIGQSRKVAVINGVAVSVGDLIQGAKVVSINTQKVTLSRNGKSIVIKPRTISIRQEK